MRLKDKIALVTGSSRGVGRAVALSYGKEGAKVVVNYTSNEKAANEVVEALQSMGTKAIAVKADVSKKADADHLVAAAIETFGGLDILVNNAGFTRPAMMLKMTEEQWDQVVDIHLKGAFLCSQAAGNQMKEQSWHQINNQLWFHLDNQLWDTFCNQLILKEMYRFNDQLRDQFWNQLEKELKKRNN